MKDGEGRRIGLGDRVRIWGDAKGEAVCSFDDRTFGRDYPESAWGT